MREAVLTVSDSELASIGIEELVSLAREAGLQSFEELACHGTGAVVQVEVARPIEEDALDALEYVVQWECVSEAGDTRLYVIEFVAPDLPDDIADPAADLVGTCDPVLTDRGATVSLVGSQEAIRRTIGEYERAGVSPDLRKLGEYDGGTNPLNDLTERQYEVIRTAFDAGYFEVPREASTEDVAAELGLDPSTVVEHLQRAERNLLDWHLSTPR